MAATIVYKPPIFVALYYVKNLVGWRKFISVMYVLADDDQPRWVFYAYISNMVLFSLYKKHALKNFLYILSFFSTKIFCIIGNSFIHKKLGGASN